MSQTFYTFLFELFDFAVDKGWLPVMKNSGLFIGIK
jgi:hypothetical protein